MASRVRLVGHKHVVIRGGTGHNIGVEVLVDVVDIGKAEPAEVVDCRPFAVIGVVDPAAPDARAARGAAHGASGTAGRAHRNLVLLVFRRSASWNRNGSISRYAVHGPLSTPSPSAHHPFHAASGRAVRAGRG